MDGENQIHPRVQKRLYITGISYEQFNLIYQISQTLYLLMLYVLKYKTDHFLNQRNSQ